MCNNVNNISEQNIAIKKPLLGNYSIHAEKYLHTDLTSFSPYVKLRFEYFPALTS